MDSRPCRRILQRVRQVLKPGGRFIFTVPHPCLPWIKPAQKPFYMRPEGGTCLRGRAFPRPHLEEGWRVCGGPSRPQDVHHLFPCARCCRFHQHAASSRSFTSPPSTWRSTPTSSGHWSILPLHVAFSFSHDQSTSSSLSRPDLRCSACRIPHALRRACRKDRLKRPCRRCSRRSRPPSCDADFRVAQSHQAMSRCWALPPLGQTPNCGGLMWSSAAVWASERPLWPTV